MSTKRENTMRSIPFRSAVASLAILGCGAATRAADVFTYATDSTSYTAAAAGQPVTVDVYLEETLTGSSQSLLTDTSAGGPVGLSGAGFYVARTGGNAGSTISLISDNGNSSAAAINPGFNVASSGVAVSSTVAADGSAARLLESDNAYPGPTGTATATGRQVLLGSLVISSPAVGTSATYSLEPYVNAPLTLGGSGQDSNTTTYEFFDLDSTNNADNGGGATYTGADSEPFESFTVATAAVPEPTSMALLAAASTAFLGRRRRRTPVA